MTMTARERGQRVINYIDSRVRRAGLGMWKLESSKEIREALVPLTEKKGTDGRALYNSENPLTLPVVVTYDYQDNVVLEQKDIIKAKMKKDEDNEVYYGNVLMLLYAQREMGKDSAKLVVQQSGIVVDYDSSNATEELTKLINKLDSDDFWKGFFKDRCPNVFYNEEGLLETKNSLSVYDDEYRKKKHYDVISSASETLKRYNPDAGKQIDAIAGYREVINYVSGSGYTLLYNYLYNRDNTQHGEFDYSEFGKKRTNSSPNYDRINVESYDIRAWGIASGTGKPFTVNKDDNATNRLSVKIASSKSDVTIPDGDELLYLKGVRLFAMNPTDYDKKHGQPLRNLKVQKLDGETWGSAEPYQQGILEIYAELHTENSKTPNILSVWVLSTGGRDNMTHEKPADWPEKARWREEGDNNDYKYFVTYVSKGTWKLNNLHRNKKDEVDFRWD